MTDLTAPVDSLHLDSCAALAVIRQSFEDARRRAARWQPTMWPPPDTDETS